MGEAFLDSLIACTELTSDTARLACFDRVNAGDEEKARKRRHAIAPTPEQQFGLSSKQVLRFGGRLRAVADADGSTCAHRRCFRDT